MSGSVGPRGREYVVHSATWLLSQALIASSSARVISSDDGSLIARIVSEHAIALETVLASDWSNDQVLEHVRAQPNLMLLTHQGQPAFTEGSGHKRGVAVFTSPDNLAEFGKIGGGPVERAVVDGQTLIDLVLQHDCDLITFNFVGPGGGREIHLDP
jgi:hypothetical protein